MSALTPDQARAMRVTAQDASWPEASLAERWEQLHAQAERLAELASITPELFDENLALFPEHLTQCSQWQQDLAWQGIEDIDAMMQPGLAALHTINTRGQDTSAPALALWREFHAARNAVLAVAHVKQTCATAQAA
ncbi:MAG: hypothetical protein AAFQ27_10460 [Pseudomonadota bacterium]